MAGALSAVYGWMLGVPFAALVIVLVVLVNRRVIR